MTSTNEPGGGAATSDALKGKTVRAPKYGDEYTGEIVAVYGNCPADQQSVKVNPDCDGPYNNGRAFDALVSDVTVLGDRERDVTNCPFCGEQLVTDVDGDADGVCEFHGALSITASGATSMGPTQPSSAD